MKPKVISCTRCKKLIEKKDALLLIDKLYCKNCVDELFERKEEPKR